jgi:hypothetical protein
MLRKTTTFLFCLAVVVGLLRVLPVAAAAAPAGPQAAFTAGNLVVYRVGDGTASLSNAAAAVFLDEYTTSGALVQSIPMPTAVSGSNRRLVASGTATSEGYLTLSTDTNYLVLTGYDADVGTASIAGTTSAAVNRVVGRVAASGAVDTSTALTDAFSGNNIRSAASTNGSDLWISGTGTNPGIRYTTLGSTSSTQLSTTVTNLRNSYIYAGQLYISTASGSAVRIGSVGTGTPTTSGQTIVSLPGVPTSGGSPYGFVLVDLDSLVAGVDTLYVADDTANVIQKYSLVAGNWTSNGTITAASVRGLTGMANGATVTLYGATGGSLYAFTDTTGYNGAVSGSVTPIASAGINTAFRGVAFTPGTPLAVTLAGFSAEAQADRVVVSWETVSELGNVGFNLYRSADAAGPLTLLAHVPSQAPGSTAGFAYNVEDLDLRQTGGTYWYTLEDVSLSGVTTLHGPVSATVQAPTAVTLSGISASPAAASTALPWLLVVAGAGLALTATRRRR